MEMLKLQNPIMSFCVMWKHYESYLYLTYTRINIWFVHVRTKVVDFDVYVALKLYEVDMCTLYCDIIV
jgi:hypothetical protein